MRGMHGWHGGRRHGGPPAGARPRRIEGFLEPAVLLALHCNPSHGYGLLEALRALGMEEYPTDVSGVYRALNGLEAAGMLTSRQDAVDSGGPPRRIYTITERGDAYLRTWVGDLRETVRFLSRFIEAYDAHERTHDGADPAAGEAV